MTHRRPPRLAAVLLTFVAVASLTGVPGPARAGADDTEPYLVGRGVADATGEIAEVGMMGYGRSDQQAEGLHTRLHSRAFVIVDRASTQRVLLVVVDSPMIFESVRQEVLRRLAARFGDLYTPRNVMITGTHTHAGPGGYSHHLLYNMTTYGYHDRTFQAITDGIVESVARAHTDLAPARLTLGHGELRDASVNRSRAAFDRNPASDRSHFPDAIDPQTSLLRIERGGRTVGVVNWFATHNTSMSGDNRLISSDNKGYAALHWEREVHGVDYLADTNPDFVAAFAQTNAGDMSPNLDLRPPTTPEDFERTRVIGLRQYGAAARLMSAPGVALTGGVDSRLVYVDMSATTVDARFTGDGREHRTCSPAIGASMAAGSMEDGPAFPTFQEGENPLWDTISDSIVYTVSPELADCQAPKDIFVPVGGLNQIYPWVAERLPVQLVRLGALYLIGIPGEVTITAGLRLRRTVAEVMGADLRNVLVAGYANAYAHYVTTPQEYDAQHYEGGSTLFGRWELPAFQQTAHRLAVAMRDGQSLPLGPVPPDLSDQQLSLQPGVVLDMPPLMHDFGDVLAQPQDSYRPGERVSVVFAGAHPNNNLHRGGSYLQVQRFDGSTWRRVADDGDWSTRLRWQRDGIAASRITVTWDIPADAVGSYRIRYHGDARSLLGGLTRFTGTSATFTVRA